MVRLPFLEPCGFDSRSAASIPDVQESDQLMAAGGREHCRLQHTNNEVRHGLDSGQNPRQDATLQSFRWRWLAHVAQLASRCPDRWMTQAMARRYIHRETMLGLFWRSSDPTPLRLGRGLWGEGRLRRDDALQKQWWMLLRRETTDSGSRPLRTERSGAVRKTCLGQSALRLAATCAVPAGILMVGPTP